MDSLTQNPRVSILQPQKKGKRTYAVKKAAKERSEELNEGIDEIKGMVKKEITALATRLNM